MSSSKSIVLTIDDCRVFQEMVCSYLHMEDYITHAAQNMQETFERIKEQKPDIILLDLLMPDIDGLDLLRKIQNNYPDIPIIMISGRGDDIDKIIGIEAGADDYLSKPVNLRELSARIKAILKRSKAPERGIEASLTKMHSNNNTSTFDRWTLDRAQFQVFDQEGKSAELTTSEFLILEKLVSSKNQALSREQLYDVLNKHDMDVYDRAVDILITRIRKKLKDSPRNPRYIKTIRNIGYLFFCEMRDETSSLGVVQ